MDFRFMTFPVGEVHCYANTTAPEKILHIPYDDYDGSLNDYIMKVLMATDVSRRLNPKLSLYLPYLPYSRQDRLTSWGEPFSLKVFASMLNAQGYESVYTLDVHSDVAAALIPNLVELPVGLILDLHSEEFLAKTLVIPDQGAYKRLKYARYRFANTVIAIKDRDTMTGALEVKAVIGDVTGKDCIIVDDICDGGGTFVLLSEELYSMGAKSVELFVTHGKFSQGFEPLIQAGIKKVYTTDSFGNIAQQSIPVEVTEVRGILKSYVH